jgi:hypothetical protein
VLKLLIAMFFMVMLSHLPFETSRAEDVKVHNIEYPSRLYGEGGAVVTVESPNRNVTCIAYKDGVPVGSGEGRTKAGIANVTILVSQRSGKLTVKCQ